VKDRKLPEIITGSEKELNMTKEYDLTSISKDLKKKIKDKISVIKEIKS
jgi:predicted small metal-binding protein